MKKKLLSLCLTLALCVGLAVPVSAAGKSSFQTPGGAMLTLSQPAECTAAWSTPSLITDGETWTGVAHRIDFGTTITVTPSENGVMEYTLVPDGNGGWKNIMYNPIYPMDGPTSETTVEPTFESSYEDESLPGGWGRREHTADRVLIVYVDSFEPVLSFLAEKETRPEKPAEPEAPAAPGFTDVPANAYYADAVKWAVANGVTTGKTATTFAPNETCTRAQIMTFLYRAAGSPKPQAEGNPYTDVSPDAYYYKACQWAYDDIGAVISKQFYPNAPCTRSTAVQFIWSASRQPEVTGGCPFTDVEQDDFMSGVINWAVEQGITQGKTATTFAPNETCTRAQIVTFLYRAFA